MKMTNPLRWAKAKLAAVAGFAVALVTTASAQEAPDYSDITDAVTTITGGLTAVVMGVIGGIVAVKFVPVVAGYIYRVARSWLGRS